MIVSLKRQKVAVQIQPGAPGSREKRLDTKRIGATSAVRIQIQRNSPAKTERPRALKKRAGMMGETGLAKAAPIPSAATACEIAEAKQDPFSQARLNGKEHYFFVFLIVIEPSVEISYEKCRVETIAGLGGYCSRTLKTSVSSGRSLWT